MSTYHHAGTVDIDVQVDLEIAGGATNTANLERALANAEFQPDQERVWRWAMIQEGVRAEVKFELLADLDDHPSQAIISFDDCQNLGAVNLRGTGFASRDIESRTITAKDGGVWREVEINVTGIAGFLLAKTAAAYGRHKPKDWYDIAFVLLHNDAGGPDVAIDRTIELFGDDLRGEVLSGIRDVAAYFDGPGAAGAQAYAQQIVADHPDNEDLDLGRAAADATLAVGRFCDRLLAAGSDLLG